MGFLCSVVAGWDEGGWFSRTRRMVVSSDVRSGFLVEEEMSKDLTDEEFVQILIKNGWSPEDASKELERVYAEAAEEDGMDFL